MEYLIADKDGNIIGGIKPFADFDKANDKLISLKAKNKQQYQIIIKRDNGTYVPVETVPRLKKTQQAEPVTQLNRERTVINDENLQTEPTEQNTENLQTNNDGTTRTRKKLVEETKKKKYVRHYNHGKSRRIDFILSKDIYNQLDERANMEYTTVTRIITQAIIEYLERHKG